MAKTDKPKNEKPKPMSPEMKYYFTEDNLYRAKENLDFMESEKYKLKKKVEELEKKKEELKKQIPEKTLEVLAKEQKWTFQIARCIREKAENIVIDFQKGRNADIWLYAVGKIRLGMIMMDHNLARFYFDNKTQKTTQIFILRPNW